MPIFFIIYISFWGIACILAFSLLALRSHQFDLFHKGYWNLLLQPWKIVTWVIATTGLIAIAPYTGDVTWDYFDASMMAILTFITAPWVVGILYKIATKKRPIWLSYVAICIWLFSASWCYDLYLLLRDGYYPNTWFTNIFASSVLYISAGLLWSLEYIPSRGIIFSFMDNSWPDINNYTSFKQIVLFALPFMVIASIAILSFL